MTADITDDDLGRIAFEAHPGHRSGGWTKLTDAGRAPWIAVAGAVRSALAALPEQPDDEPSENLLTPRDIDVIRSAAAWMDDEEGMPLTAADLRRIADNLDRAPFPLLPARPRVPAVPPAPEPPSVVHATGETWYTVEAGAAPAPQPADERPARGPDALWAVSHTVRRSVDFDGFHIFTGPERATVGSVSVSDESWQRMERPDELIVRIEHPGGDPCPPAAAPQEEERPSRIRLLAHIEGYMAGRILKPEGWNEPTGQPWVRSAYTANGTVRLPAGSWEPVVPPVTRPERGDRVEVVGGDWKTLYGREGYVERVDEDGDCWVRIDGHDWCIGPDGLNIIRPPAAVPPVTQPEPEQAPTRLRIEVGRFDWCDLGDLFDISHWTWGPEGPVPVVIASDGLPRFMVDRGWWRPAAAPVTRQRGEDPEAVELFPGAQLTVAAPVTQQEPPPGERELRRLQDLSDAYDEACAAEGLLHGTPIALFVRHHRNNAAMAAIIDKYARDAELAAASSSASQPEPECAAQGHPMVAQSCPCGALSLVPTGWPNEPPSASQPSPSREQIAAMAPECSDRGDNGELTDWAAGWNACRSEVFDLLDRAGASQPAHTEPPEWHADVTRWLEATNHWRWPDDLPHKPSPPRMTPAEERMALRGAHAALEAVAALAGVEVEP